MIIQDQTETLEFLGQALGNDADDAREIVETHISFILLTGERAYKMKRAVKLPYADFSTPEQRLHFCRREVALNRRTAPDLYLGVRRITREADGGLTLDGAGELVDATVEMRRFDEACLFDRMAGEGKLTPAIMSAVASSIARFHGEAEIIRGCGGAANMSGVLDINEAGFATSHVFAQAEVEAFNAAFRAALERYRERLDRREARGRVRRCHGDLHLRNICMFEGQPTLFDCIDFNDRMASVDILYDLAFLLMDLWHRDLRDLANLVANRYLDAMDDEDGFALVPFFMAVRAAVRAHVTATQAEDGGAGRRDELAATARSYFELAGRLLDVEPPVLVAIGGLSGSGKTTMAEALAAKVGGAPGARIFESDRIRKAMFGVSAETRLAPSAYEPAVSDDVYAAMASKARKMLHSGGSVVADAVFDRPQRRDTIEQAARDAGAAFTGLWIEADRETLRRRIVERVGGPSDATVDVLERQLERDVGTMHWRRITSAEPLPDVKPEWLTGRAAGGRYGLSSSVASLRFPSDG
ncbi:bifunctional aminoglycoside phosphotransferase/ATP-binding protein [Mesorhizobium xinjiangense]|uniref:bifunctional aminoglycoside phosphotransferase/ATP-binding protein n=1 Tax=Mesorhizobium xinjiangense TaxID=2678685 RepID=UPI0012ECD9B7|nr:bifunctional aminoglycoside phosphotransferase/ATP-binding protein [Mesorhizobium xinjiangense]